LEAAGICEREMIKLRLLQGVIIIIWTPDPRGPLRIIKVVLARCSDMLQHTVLFTAHTRNLFIVKPRKRSQNLSVFLWASSCSSAMGPSEMLVTVTIIDLAKKDDVSFGFIRLSMELQPIFPGEGNCTENNLPLNRKTARMADIGPFILSTYFNIIIAPDNMDFREASNITEKLQPIRM